MNPMALWAVFIVGHNGWCEFEAVAIPPSPVDSYRWAMECGYGLVRVQMIPAWTTWRDVETGVSRGWNLAPLSGWWDVYWAAADGEELPKPWHRWPAWRSEFDPLPRSLNDQPRHSSFDVDEFDGTAVVADLGTPPTEQEDRGLCCELCGIAAASIHGRGDSDLSGLDWRDCRFGRPLLCQRCWRDHWREVRDAKDARDFQRTLLSIRSSDPRLWWEWDWDDDLQIGTDRGRELWRMWYRDGYLKSRAWSEQRNRLLRRSNGHCEWCWEPASRVGWLEGHHIEYKDVGHESLEDLILLCAACHDAAHGEKEPKAPAAGRTYAERYYRLGRRRIARRLAAKAAVSSQLAKVAGPQ